MLLPRLELRVTPRLFQRRLRGTAAWTAAFQPANGVDGGFNHLEGAPSLGAGKFDQTLFFPA